MVVKLSGGVHFGQNRIIDNEKFEMGDTRDSVSLKRIVFVTVGTTCFDALVKAVDTLEVKQELTRRGYTHLLIQMGRGTYVPTKAAVSLSGSCHVFAESLVVKFTNGIQMFVKLIKFCTTGIRGKEKDACISSIRNKPKSSKIGVMEFFHYRNFIGASSVAALTKSTLSLGEDGLMAVDYFTFSSSIADHLRSASLVISHAGSGSIFETLRHGKPLIVVVNEDLMDNHQSELAEELAARKHLYCAHPQSLHQVIAGMDLESLLPYQPGDATPVAKLINRFLGFPDD
ncbi:glyco-tran 28 C domain-containing protein [Citrus sinensis]|uniref:Glyco-tran 28 C domain-containing protein n=2 Tax=Citrus sinensis TaxID=2711 RepID=A0ACB8NHX5_CITSI|nr:glyco-tran 28 C domain-containing protein [Citrus sinensis]